MGTEEGTKDPHHLFMGEAALQVSQVGPQSVYRGVLQRDGLFGWEDTAPNTKGTGSGGRFQKVWGLSA